MTRVFRIAAVLILTAATACAGIRSAQNAESPGGKNIVPNPSFERMEGEVPAGGWGTQNWGGRVDFKVAESGRSGARSVLLDSPTGADSAWRIMLTVRPYSTYRISCWMKTEDLEPLSGRGACLTIHDHGDFHTEYVTGTTDWTHHETIFETGAVSEIQLNLMIGFYGLAKGKVWYDDVAVELLDTKELAPAAIVDASAEAEPISPLIYGQFIEHLGRCIYGGIWAEMLEDRKFFYDVGAGESPWRPLGDVASVVMAQEEPWVNDHTPEIVLDAAPQGIVHGALGLEAGREYEGRIVLRAEPGAGPVDVALVWGDGPEERDVVRIEEFDAGYAAFPLAFESGGDTLEGRLEISGRGVGKFRVGAVSLMPADNIDGMRRDTLELVRELDSPIYRWPGGCFVGGYDWRQGLGDPDKRPTITNPHWRGIEHNDFGLHEYMRFCELVGAEPFICVDTGPAPVELSRLEVEYCNGSVDTPMGALRARNGQPEPFDVEWWAVGNEMFGQWQNGWMPLEQYVVKHNEVAEAMWSVDPDIKLIGVGAVGGWDEGMFRNCSDHMDYISEHFYCQERPGVLEHVRQIPDQIKRIADAHRRYRETIPQLEGKTIPIAMDEWNYWYGPHVYGELGTRYFLKDALGIAAGLHEYARNTDMIVMANYAQTVNVIGAIKTSKTDAAMAATGLVLKLYRTQFGSIPIMIDGDVRPLDVAVALTPDRKQMTVGVVNPMDVSMPLALEFRELEPEDEGTQWTISGDDPMVFNEPGVEPSLKIEESLFDGGLEDLTVAPYSVTLIKVDLD